MSTQLLSELPAPMDFFEAARQAAGERSMTIVLGPLSLEFSGLDDSLAEILIKRYSPYSTDGRSSVSNAVKIRLYIEDRDYFIHPPRTTEVARVLLAYDASTQCVRYTSYRVAGWFDTQGGGGVALLAHGGYEPPERAIENYVRSCVAWQAATRGGALVHAASAVLGGKGYLFYGESGAGKSTLSECNRRARIISDDLSLLVPGDAGQLMLVGSPFRGTYTGGDPVVGAFPLAAGFRIVQDDHAEVRSISRIRALSEFVGNLPFVAEAYSKRPDLFERIEQALVNVPLRHLHFRKDESYWDAILNAD